MPAKKRSQGVAVVAPAQDTELATLECDCIVTLAKTHTHAGVEHGPGAQLAVCQADRDWMFENGVIEA